MYYMYDIKFFLLGFFFLQWDEFFDQVQPVATQLPYMVCIGNHERDFPNSG